MFTFEIIRGKLTREINARTPNIDPLAHALA